MSKVKQTIVEQGDIPTATQLNEPYVDTAALNVQEYNTANDWAMRAHFDTNTSKINSTYFISSQTSGSYNSTTFTTVSGMSIVMSNTAINNEVLRVNWDALVGQITYGGGVTNAGINYAFRVLVATNVGNVFIAPGVYSCVARSVPTASPAINQQPIQWRSCAGSQILRILPGVDVTSVQLQVKVCDVANTIDVHRANMSVVIGRR